MVRCRRWHITTGCRRNIQSRIPAAINADVTSSQSMSWTALNLAPLRACGAHSFDALRVCQPRMKKNAVGNRARSPSKIASAQASQDLCSKSR
jgi:hypothetical protein